MYTSKVLASFVFGLAVSSVATAQVYESKDAQGNTSFSDMPSEGAEVVQVPTTNTADPAPDIPASPDPVSAPDKPGRTPTSPAQSGGGSDGEDYIYHGGHAADNDDIQQRRERVEHHREVGGGAPAKGTPVHVVPRPAAGGRR